MGLPGRKSRTRGWLQVGASALVLVAALVAAGRGKPWQQLAHLRAAWLGLAALLLGAQFPIMAARWCLFARELGVALPFSRALTEYFFAGFLNQVLPLGICGDVTRVLREGKRSEPLGGGYTPAALAVALERGSGQLALWLIVLAVLPAWTAQLVPTYTNVGSAVLVALLLVVVLLGLAATLLRRSRWRQRVRQGMHALWAPRMLALHLPLSLVLVLLHVGAFVCVARALALPLSLSLAVRVVPLVLVATTLPFFVGGWGIREASVASLYHLAGLSGADGISIAVAYGLLGLLVSTPGLAALRPSLRLTTPPPSGSMHEQALR